MGDPTQFDSAVASVSQQFATVMSAPIPFAIIGALVAYVIWKVIDHHYSGRLASKDDLIALRDAQLQDYQVKLDGASPDAAKARIDALEERINQQLAALEPRRVSADQRRALSAVLDAHRGCSINLCSDAASADAAQMSQGLTAAFNSSGWSVQNGIVMGLGNPPLSGIGIRVADPQKPTPQQAAVMKAFDAANLRYDLQIGNMRLRDNAPVPVAEIILTNRLQD